VYNIIRSVIVNTQDVESLELLETFPGYTEPPIESLYEKEKANEQEKETGEPKVEELLRDAAACVQRRRAYKAKLE